MTRRALDEETRRLLDRIEQRLPPSPVREVAMFGAVAVMLDDAMVVAVQKDLSLLVRVDPADDDELLRRDDASRPEMGGRSMGAGWMRVGADSVRDDAGLDDWLARAVRFWGRRAAAARP